MGRADIPLLLNRAVGVERERERVVPATPASAAAAAASEPRQRRRRRRRQRRQRRRSTWGKGAGLACAGPLGEEPPAAEDTAPRPSTGAVSLGVPVLGAPRCGPYISRATDCITRNNCGARARTRWTACYESGAGGRSPPCCRGPGCGGRVRQRLGGAAGREVGSLAPCLKATT
eukprot:scaffold2639_cov385-Prasinococcus_capsulatus_cf.AAC.14